jgi:hypothetical protein
MPDAEPIDLRCSFCHKSQRDVKKLIAGPAAFICDECIDVCNEILDDGGIPAGRGPKAGSRAAVRADEYMGMARDLAGAGNFVGAAREVRNAALEALRGAALLEREAATQWSETKVVVAALESDSEVARLLQIEDEAHVILRVSVDGAAFTAREIERALDVTAALVESLRKKIAAAESVPRKGRD